MPKTLALAIIHGIGKQDPSFADQAVKELLQR
jgi:hypothetical protein